MKKILIGLFLIFTFLPNVLADGCASKSNVDKNVDAEYYCYYNKTGMKSDNEEYNVIVGISSDYKEAYADIGACDNSVGGPGTEPIKNWLYNDSNWDTDLNDSFSAKDYYEKNKKCPEMAYIHYYPIEYSLYLINNYQLNSLRDTFSYAVAQDNEDEYYLVDFDEPEEVKMSCSYSVDMDANTASNGSENYKVNFNLDFSQQGKIINANNIEQRTSISPEIGTGYKYVGEVCPQMYICHVTGKSYSGGHGMAVFEYKYELYFADYSIDNRNKCKAISCTNTDSPYCDPGNLESYICPTYADLFLRFDNSYNEYKNDPKNPVKNEQYRANKEIIKNYCNSVLSNLNADNPCTKTCLEFQEKIKKEYTLGAHTGNSECGFSERLLVWASNILRWIKYILPVAVIIFGILDFIKAIGADKDDEMKKAQKRFVIRLIAAALVFIIPLILEFVLDKMGFGYNDCGLF